MAISVEGEDYFGTVWYLWGSSFGICIRFGIYRAKPSGRYDSAREHWCVVLLCCCVLAVGGHMKAPKGSLISLMIVHHARRMHGMT
jgi:hypothetical protein